MNSPRYQTITYYLIMATVIPLVGMNGCGSVDVGHHRLPQPPPSTTSSKGINTTPIIKATQRAYKINGKTYYPIPHAKGFNQCGLASWYGPPFHGRRTSNGETYNMYADTAAHKTLPMGTRVLVKNLENNRTTVVRINDRGPFVKGRIIDLSKKAAKDIGIFRKGTARVEITALGETETVTRGRQKIERFLPYPDLNKGKFYIQLGSFQYKGNSLRLKKELLARGMTPVVEPFQHGEQLFYRVQVLGGHTVDQAERRKTGLTTEFPGAFVIRKD